jgi:hypothetical protein
VVIGLLLAVYVSSYAYLSRRGMAEAAEVGWPCFFYCPLADVVPYRNFPRQHRWAVSVYNPLNQLDRACFGGGTPCRGVTWGLSRGSP